LKKNDPIYLNTRKKILSKSNPFYFSGKLGEGLGSPHTERGYIWPLYIIMRGLTSDSKEEIELCFNQLIESTTNTTFIHESFHIDDANKFTRKWFAWANSFFGYFFNTIVDDYPEIIFSINKEK